MSTRHCLFCCKSIKHGNKKFIGEHYLLVFFIDANSFHLPEDDTSDEDKIVYEDNIIYEDNINIESLEKIEFEE